MILFQKPLSQKLTALILVISVISLIVGPILLYPQKAQAACEVDIGEHEQQDDANDLFEKWEKLWKTWKEGNWSELISIAASWLWDKAKKLVMWALGVLLNILLHEILAELTNEIIEWIQGEGGQEPRFLAGNFSDWLKGAADRAAGAFISQYLGAGWLCEPFDMDIKIALMDVPAFEEEVDCSLSDIVANVQGFYGNFSQGGWKGWTELTKPRNNLYGAYLLSQAEKMNAEEIAEREREKELEMGEGFLSPKDCVWSDKTGAEVERQTEVWGAPTLPAACYPDPDNPGYTVGGFVSPCDHRCIIFTPASTVKAVTDKAVTNYWDQINAQISAATAKAGPYDVYIQAIINALINRVLTEGMGLLQAEPILGPGDDPGVIIPPIVDPDQVLQDIHAAEGILAQLLLLRDELDLLLAEQQSNLAVLNLILEAYQDLIPLLNQVIAACAGTPYESYITWAQETKDDITNNLGPSVIQRIAELEADIEHTIYVIGLADTAIALVQDFIAEANNWLAVWEAVGGDPEHPDLIAATTALEAAKVAAIEAIQDVVREINGVVIGDTFVDLTIEVMRAYENVVEEAFDLKDLRGSPSWPEPGTLYGELDDANVMISTAESYIATCEAYVPPGNGGNGGNGE